MTNGATGVGVNNQNYQMAFRAKGVNKQKAIEVVDKLGIQMPRDMELSRRPIEVQRETMLSRVLSNLKIKDLFTGKVVEPKETTTEHINTVIETANKASRDVYLEQLRKTNPELYKEVLRRDAEHKVALMTNMEIIKEFVNGIFKK